MTPTSKADVWSSNNIYIIFSIVANPKDKNTEYIIPSNLSLKLFSFSKLGISTNSFNPSGNNIYGNFHADFMKNKICLIGCPKLDEGDYADKLTAIIQQNQIQSITVVRMEVPCCSGIVNAVKTALLQSGKMIPWQVAVVSTDGQLIA